MTPVGTGGSAERGPGGPVTLTGVQDEFPEWLCWRGPDGPSGKFFGLHRRWPAGSGYQVKADDPAGLWAGIAAEGSENLRVIMLGPPFGLPEGHPHFGPDSG